VNRWAVRILFSLVIIAVLFGIAFLGAWIAAAIGLAVICG
jgi:hypothetical protein